MQFINARQRRHGGRRRYSELAGFIPRWSKCCCIRATYYRTLNTAHLAFISHPPAYCRNLMMYKSGFYIRSTYQRKPRSWNSTWLHYAFDETSPSLVVSTEHHCAKALLHFGDSFAELLPHEIPPRGKSIATLFKSSNGLEGGIWRLCGDLPLA